MGALRQPHRPAIPQAQGPQLTLIEPGAFALNDRPAPEPIPFIPARGFSNCHAQTLLGTLLPLQTKLSGTTQRKLRLQDDDFIVLHDDRPAAWERGDHVVLLMHGLAGCHNSGYMVRTSSKLHLRGVRTFRMDHRGCGAGAQLARRPYHAGRTDDLDAAIRMIERLCPGSPISVAGYSISGNLLLRYLGENGAAASLSLFRAVAICPPIDLEQCIAALDDSRFGARYNWYFTRRLLDHVATGPLWRDDLPLASLARLPRRLYDFDDVFTAPASGFRSAKDYYQQVSARNVIADIRVHTTILAAADDPLVCPAPLCETALPTNVRMFVTEHGGHLGFIGRSGIDPDRRWMDWRVIEWLLD